MAEAKKPEGKKIVDVAHPGKMAPSGNSKSVIIPSRPIMRDPMMAEESTKVEDELPAAKTAEAVIKPIAEDAKIAKKQDDKLAKPVEDVKPEKKPDDKKTIAVLAEEAAVAVAKDQPARHVLPLG